jgi:hypothetical protein
MNRKNLLSLCCVCFFIVLALGSTSTYKLGAGDFYTENKVEDRSEKSNYLVKNDGTRVYGEKIKWKSGALVKDQIQIDGEKFKIPEIIGYREGDIYYGRYRNEYIRRIIHGKINIYRLLSEVSTTSTDASGHTRTTSRTEVGYLYQKGDDAGMVDLFSKNDLQALVHDCPLALEMANLSDKKMRKAIRKDRNYLNSVIDVYNNDCKAGYLK